VGASSCAQLIYDDVQNETVSIISKAIKYKENAMPSPFKITERSEKGLLTPHNCVLVQIDLQPQMLFGVSNFDRHAIISNNVVLALAADG
jgi:hypothetical protein